MKLAVTSQNFRTVTGHAGKSRRFIVFETEAGSVPHELERLDLPKEMSFHEFHGDGPHPIDGIDLLITGGCGAGFARRLAQRGIAVVVTDIQEPLEAIAAVMSGRLAAVDPSTMGHHHHHGHSPHS